MSFDCILYTCMCVCVLCRVGAITYFVCVVCVSVHVEVILHCRYQIVHTHKLFARFLMSQLHYLVSAFNAQFISPYRCKFSSKCTILLQLYIFSGYVLKYCRTRKESVAYVRCVHTREHILFLFYDGTPPMLLNFKRINLCLCI